MTMTKVIMMFNQVGSIMEASWFNIMILSIAIIILIILMIENDDGNDYFDGYVEWGWIHQGGGGEWVGCQATLSNPGQPRLPSSSSSTSSSSSSPPSSSQSGCSSFFSWNQFHPSANVNCVAEFKLNFVFWCQIRVFWSNSSFTISVWFSPPEGKPPDSSLPSSGWPFFLNSLLYHNINHWPMIF